MLVSAFDYHLPPELIATEPPAERAGARMLHLRRAAGKLQDCWLQDCWFREFPSLLRSDDLVVFNNTRVFPARLYGRRQGSRAQTVSGRNPAARQFLTGQAEVLLTKQLSADALQWEALVHPGRKIPVGERLFFGSDDLGLQAEVVSRGDYGIRRLQFAPVDDFFARVEQIGHVPLPPYIHREDQSDDRERYQTVYASVRGSVAAPTAGLHFTPEILQAMRERGIEMAEVTLHVGLGTFQPVRAEQVEEHQMHRESYSISEQAAQQINRARQQGRRIVAVGTTTVRTLEHAASTGNYEIGAGAGEADLFIYPGFHFRVIGALLTNFHLPKSTLLMLVSAFAGREPVLRAYHHAVEARYRFYSYGDCMWIE